MCCEKTKFDDELGVTGRRAWFRVGVGERRDNEEVGRRIEGVCGRTVVLTGVPLSTDDGR